MASDPGASPPSPDFLPTPQRARHWMRTWRFALSSIVLAVGVALTTLAFASFTPLSTTWPFSGIDQYTNPTGGINWNLWFVVVGPILAIIGAYLVGAYLVARRRFEQLMRSRSKAELLRNLPEIEELLWDLTPADQQRYLAKCVEFRIRR
ncbi:MAG: hypothetical protein ACREBT_07025 [Thermoplasmata archaeon]